MKTNYLIFSFFSIVFTLILSNSCSKGGSDVIDVIDVPDVPDVSLPTVTTGDVFNIGYTSAEVNGSIVSNGGSELLMSGFCWSTNHNPTTADLKEGFSDNRIGNIRSHMQDLIEDTSYYVRAYANNSVGTAYGTEKTFKTGLSCQTMVDRQPGYEVWAGDTPYYQEVNHYDYFYNIDKYNYTKIGGGTTTQSFNTENYKYYLIVANYWTCIDAIEFNDGSFLNNNSVTLFTGLTEPENILGAPDQISGKMGIKGFCPPNNASHNGYITDDATIISRGGGLKVIVVDGCQ